MVQRINQIVQDSGLTKTEFGKRLNLSQSMISRICLGTAVPSDRTISDICREFGVNRIWLETGDGEPYQSLTRKEKLARIFGDVLVGTPTEKNIFIESIAQLPDEVFPILVQSWIESAKRMKQLLDEEKTE